eukprot:scaffold582826_cov43-Attheya_sp.AAC.2
MTMVATLKIASDMTSPNATKTLRPLTRISSVAIMACRALADRRCRRALASKSGGKVKTIVGGAPPEVLSNTKEAPSSPPPTAARSPHSSADASSTLIPSSVANRAGRIVRSGHFFTAVKTRWSNGGDDKSKSSS